MLPADETLAEVRVSWVANNLTSGLCLSSVLCFSIPNDLD
jgi:hypothetical protein